MPVTGRVLLALARIFTALGRAHSAVVAAGFLVAGWIWWKRRPHLAFAILLIVLVGRGLAEAQKYWIARVRPDLEPHLVVVKTSSFPSGHATSSMIFYLTVALALTRVLGGIGSPRRSAILLSLLIGTSRVMLGVHWPSDVIGGWAFGLLWVLVTLRLAGRIAGSQFRRWPNCAISRRGKGEGE